MAHKRRRSPDTDAGLELERVLAKGKPTVQRLSGLLADRTSAVDWDASIPAFCRNRSSTARMLELVLDAAGKKGRVGVARAIEETCAGAAAPEVLELLAERAARCDAWTKAVRWGQALLDFLRNKKCLDCRFRSFDKVLVILVTHAKMSEAEWGICISAYCQCPRVTGPGLEEMLAKHKAGAKSKAGVKFNGTYDLLTNVAAKTSWEELYTVAAKYGGDIASVLPELWYQRRGTADEEFREEMLWLAAKQVAKEPRSRRDAWVRAVLLDDENGNGWGALDDAGEPLPWDFEYRNWKTTGPRMTVPRHGFLKKMASELRTKVRCTCCSTCGTMLDLHFEKEDASGAGLTWDGCRVAAEELAAPESGLCAAGLSVAHPAPQLVSTESCNAFFAAGAMAAHAVLEGATFPTPLGRPLLRAFTNHLEPYTSDCECCSGTEGALEDLAHIDKVLAKQLRGLRSLAPDELEALELSFDHEELVNTKKEPKLVSVDLRKVLVRPLERKRIPQHGNVGSDGQLLELYLKARALHRIHGGVAKQLQAFAAGAAHVLPPVLLRVLGCVYSLEEVSELISGTGAVRKADVAAWKQHTQYEGSTVMGGSLLGRTHRLAQDFWKVVENHMTDADRGRLLQFVTGSPRIPMGGFDKLPEKFTIETSWYLRTEDLPRASVCSATLTLPPYKNLPTLKKNLLLAIRHMEFEE